MSGNPGNLVTWWRTRLLRQRRLLLTCVIAGAGVSALVAAIVPPRYVAHTGVAILDTRLLTTFQVSSSSSDTEEVEAALMSAPQSALQGSPQLAASYLASRWQTLVALVENESIAESVLRRLGADASPEEIKPGALLDRVEATLKRGEGGDRDITNVIEIRVRGADPVRAARVADLWAGEYVDLVNRTLGPCADLPVLRRRLEEARRDLDAADLALAEFHADSRLEELASQRSEVRSTLEVLRRARHSELAKAGQAADPDALLDALDRQFAPDARLSKAIAAQEGRARELTSTIEKEEASLRRLEEERDRTRDTCAAVASRLAKLPSKSELSGEDVRLLGKAAVPTVPVAPTPKQTVVLGTLAGLLIGIALAYFREALRAASEPAPRPLGAEVALATNFSQPAMCSDRPEAVSLGRDSV